MLSIKLSVAIPASELKYNNTLIGGTCRTPSAWVERTKRGREEEENEVEEDKTGSGRSIDPSASSSRKQVSPRKTGLIRKILIFIHTRRGGGRPGGKASSKSPEGQKVDGAGLLFSIRQNWQARCMHYLCMQSAFLQNVQCSNVLVLKNIVHENTRKIYR